MIKIGGYQGDGSILTKSLTDFAARLAVLWPDNPLQLRPDITASGDTARALFDGVESGSWNICYMASGYLSARVPALRFVDLPMLVEDRAQALAALDGLAGQIVTSAIEAASGLKVLGFWDNGVRHITNGVRPIRSPDDCVGLTIRTLDSPIYRTTLASFGFTPMFADVRDFAAKAASGEIDAQENPLTNVVNFGIHRHHRHVSLTGHVFGVALLAANRAWFDGLSSREREVVMESAAESTRLQRRLAAGEDALALDAMVAVGCAIIHPGNLDMAAFQAAARPVREKVILEVPAALIEAWPG